MSGLDRWAEWLLTRRFGGQKQAPGWLEGLAAVRDRVLDGTGLEPGGTLLDVGAGDGLIAFGALERGAGEVVFGDVSQTCSTTRAAWPSSSAWPSGAVSCAHRRTISARSRTGRSVP